MRKFLKVLILAVVSVATSKAANKIACDFIDTVNISSGFLDSKGHFHHNGNIYTKEMFTVFDYVVDHFDGIKKVEPHFRGCVCRFKSCIRLCCRDSLNIESDCVKTKILSVPTKNGQEEIDLSSEKFAIIEGWPCEKMYALEPQEYDYDEWFFEVISFRHF